MSGDIRSLVGARIDAVLHQVNEQRDTGEVGTRARKEEGRELICVMRVGPKYDFCCSICMHVLSNPLMLSCN